MLRIVVLALALANVGFFAWSRGWMDSVVGVKAQGDREPGRLLLQVDPGVIRVLPSSAAASAAPAPTAPP